jgi:hypothetical protein
MRQMIWRSNPGRGKRFISSPKCPERPPVQTGVYLKSGIICINIVLLYLSELLMNCKKYACMKFCVNQKGKLESPPHTNTHKFILQKLWSLALLRHNVNLPVVSFVGAVVVH